MASANEGVLNISNGQHFEDIRKSIPCVCIFKIYRWRRILRWCKFQNCQLFALKRDLKKRLSLTPRREEEQAQDFLTEHGMAFLLKFSTTEPIWHLAIVLGHTYNRHGLVDFTSPFGAANFSVFAALPSIRVKPDAVFSSFTPAVWLRISLSLWLVSSSLHQRFVMNMIPSSLQLST